MKAIILAGGSGTRLWPLSKSSMPKQFLPLFGTQSLLQMTAERLGKLVPRDDIYVVAPPIHTEIIQKQLTELFGCPFQNVIVEPVPRNTAPAIALAVRHLQDCHKLKADERILVCPSDHYFEAPERFLEALEKSSRSDADKIITFGITPTFPSTGFGYIELDAPPTGVMQPVICFREKPGQENAGRFVASGKFLWNAGIFMFTSRTFQEELRLHADSLYQAVMNRPSDEAVQYFSDLHAVSIDVAVMEKSQSILCQKLDAGWTDLGSWDALYRILPKDENGNAVSGNVILQEVQNSLVMGKEKMIGLYGVRDVVVVDTDDAILVCDRKKSQGVRQLAEKAKTALKK